MFRKRVLIIEDDKRTVEEIHCVLENNGYETEVALTPQVGLAILAERRMDAAVLDAQLEETDSGWTLLKQIRETNPALPIVLINAPKQKGLSEIARRAGASRFMAQPVNPERVGAEVVKILGV